MSEEPTEGFSSQINNFGSKDTRNPRKGYRFSGSDCIEMLLVRFRIGNRLVYHRWLCCKYVDQHSIKYSVYMQHLLENGTQNTSTMASTPYSDAQTETQGLITELLARYSDKYGLSSLTPSIYDTAWVSLVHSNVNNLPQWTFPEAFDFIYSKQTPDGGWKGNGSVPDAIICTLACLLSLVKHASTPGLSCNYTNEDLTSRASLASQYLTDQLQGWDVLATERIAFEIIVPSLLEQLKACGYSFNFPEHETLMKLCEVKMTKIQPEVIYTKGTSVIHSLEALVGKLDFDQVGQHLRNGSMLASPASTAAFLIHASEWNVEAEQYLRHVLNSCRHYGYGAVCNVYPTTVFELAWVST